jgi:hypothetical protein
MKWFNIKLLSLFLLTISASAFAQTADEIISKHIAAIGGADAWNKVNSIRQEGSMQVQGADVAIVLTAVNGKGSRQDITLTSMGMSGYQIITPTEGWNYMPFNGQMSPEAMTADDVAQAQDDLDTHGSLVDYKAKGHTVEYLGKEDVDGTEAYKIKVTLKGGKIQTLFFDPETFYVIRSTVKQKVNGQEIEQSSDLSNYEKLPEGIVVPKTITLPFGDLTITKVEVNGTVDEKLFKKPE